MPYPEYRAWINKASKDGLPMQRLEAILAKGFAYLGAIQGGKIKPLDLLPGCHEEKALSGKAADTAIRAYVDKFARLKRRNGNGR